MPIRQGAAIFHHTNHPVHSVKVAIGANCRPDFMAPLRLSTMLRFGSNTMARRFRSSVDNARCAGNRRLVRNSRREF
jgi:hypothetical protein